MKNLNKINKTGGVRDEFNTSKRAKPGNKFIKLLRKLIAISTDILPVSMGMRAKLYRLRGVDVGKDCLLGKLDIDGIYPQDIHIGDGSTVTKGVCLLTHFYNTKVLTEHAYTRGEIRIGRRCYVGMNTIFSKPVTVGDGAVIGAGSVVTKDIPPYEVWAGVPARFIVRRCEQDEIPSSFKPK